jgi:hypothetical protein
MPMTAILHLRLSEFHHFMANYQRFRDVFSNMTTWTAAQFITMSLKAEGTLPVKSLVYDLEKMMSEATAHRAVHLCAKEGFIKLVETSDRRTQGAFLTDKGEEFVGLLVGTWQKIWDKKGVVYDPSRAKVG